MTRTVLARVAEDIAGDPGVTLKRLAWAYGCARKGSDEERKLRALLVQRVLETQGKEET